MPITKSWLLLCPCLLLGLCVPAFSQDTIKIGEFGSLTGDNASYGVSQNQGIQMAVEEDYSVGLTQFARDYLQNNGVQVVKEQSYSSGDKDFRAQLTDIKSANPDVILITGYYPEVSLIIREARQLGIKAKFAGGDGWDGASLIPVGGKAIEGSYFSNHFSTEDKSPAVQQFVEKYKNKYNKLPDAFAALGYDSVNLLADAIKRAGSTDPEKLRDAIAGTKDFPGVTGKITINPERNANKSAVIITIKNGALHYFGTIEPKST